MFESDLPKVFSDKSVFSTVEQRLLARANTFWPIAVVSEADSVSSVSASACHSSGPKGVSPGQKALLHGTRSGPDQ